ncbi:hypothetical protein AaE_001864 [Aphanomyces astaci]|uniref:PDZ domain-containing protein n=1 Tax=Aphanomyces astaci TaxID=112090 RepID=A0A6A5AQ38_APHAT|nr:hypothetical protein AaE_001864 [Aphanomyces astaci]
MTTRHSHTIHKPVKVLPSTSQLWPSHTKPDNYFVKWTGGDLGLALTSEPVCVSRVTGKGCPQRHLELVRPGDVLLSVNGLPTKHLGMDVVLRILRHCRLPATLHFGRPGFDDFWTYPHRSSMPRFPPSSLGLETPRPRRMSFTPPSCYVDDITSPRNSKGPVKSPLVSNPAASERVSSIHGGRHSSPF